MGQAALNQFPWVNVKYDFKCRSKDVIWTEDHVSRIKDEVENFCTLKFTED